MRTAMGENIFYRNYIASAATRGSESCGREGERV